MRIVAQSRVQVVLLMRRSMAFDWGLLAGILCPKGTVTRYIIVVGWDRRLVFFEDARTKVVASNRQVPAHQPAHVSDILAAALMEASPNLVTGASTGELKVWNIESGSVRHILERPGLRTLPAHKRPVEAVAFIRGLPRLRHICAAVGHDQVVHFWDVLQGCLLFRFFTGVMTQVLAMPECDVQGPCRIATRAQVSWTKRRAYRTCWQHAGSTPQRYCSGGTRLRRASMETLAVSQTPLLCCKRSSLA